MFLLLTLILSANAGIILPTVYDTVTPGTFIVDEHRNTSFCGCNSAGDRLDMVTDECERLSDVSCAIAASSAGIIFGQNATFEVDFRSVLNRAQITSFGVGTFFQSTSTYGAQIRNNNVFNPVSFIQWDGNDEGSICLKGEDGQTGGLGGIDLSEGGTRNALLVPIFSLDGDMLLEIVIWNTQNEFEKRIVHIPNFDDTSSKFWHLDIPLGTPGILSVVPFKNNSIFSDVDAVQIRFLPQTTTFDGIRFGFNFERNIPIITGTVSGCSYDERFTAPELNLQNCANTAPATPVFRVHAEFGECYGDIFTPPFPGLRPSENPFSYSTALWDSLPYGNTFTFTDVTNFTYDPGSEAPAGFDFLSAAFYTPLDIFSPVDNGPGRIFSQWQASSIAGPLFPRPNYGKWRLDFASQPGNGLFRSVNVSFFSEDIMFFTGIPYCSGNSAAGPSLIALDVNLNPIGSPVGPFSLIDPTPTGFSNKYVGTGFIDVGSDIMRAVIVDWGTFNGCDSYTMFPFIQNIQNLGVDGFMLKADTTCHRPADRTPLCRIVQGRLFVDVDESGTYDPEIDTAPMPLWLTTIGITPSGPGVRNLLDYASVGINGTYFTECYPIGTVLSIDITTSMPIGLTTLNQLPFEYVVTDDCVPTIPAIGLGNLNGVFFRVYWDQNNNGMDDIEPGIEGVNFKITKSEEPMTGDMHFGTSDSNGNVYIPAVVGGNYTLDLLDDNNRLLGFTLSMNMDPTNISLPLNVTMPTTIVDNFGFTKSLPTCFATISPLVLDAFDGINTPLMTNVSVPTSSQIETMGTGITAERSVLLEGRAPTFMAAWGNTMPNMAMLMSYPNLLSKVTLQWNLNETGVDLTQNQTLTSIVATFPQVYGDHLLTLTVGTETQQLRVKDCPMMDLSCVPRVATFFFGDLSEYENATTIQLMIESEQQRTSGSSIIISNLETSCTLCEQEITFLETDFPTSTTTPFETLAQCTKIMPYGHSVQFSQSQHVLNAADGTLLTANLADTLTLDFDSLNEGANTTQKIRAIELMLRAQDCSGAAVSGFAIQLLDSDLAPIAPVEQAQNLTSIGGGAFETTYALDVGQNAIKAVRVFYDNVTCDGLVGLSNVKFSTDGACGGNYRCPITSGASIAAFVVPISLAGFVLLLGCCGALKGHYWETRERMRPRRVARKMGYKSR